MGSEVRELSYWYDTVKNQILDRNEKSVASWSKYKNDLDTTKSLLCEIPKKIKHDVMVPIGPKALMRGKIVHTNEYLVNIGETWFVKKSAHQAIEVCERRAMSCDEMLEKLRKERELIVNKTNVPAEEEAFGSDKRPEIIEYVTEEENENWKKQHRIREKEYHQKLAELRNKKKKSIETEEDLWRHLDELELQEELEDELNRLNAEYSSEEDICENNLDFNFSDTKNYNLELGSKEENCKNENKSDDLMKTKRKVSFADDMYSSDDEPLRLEIKHSSQLPVSCDSHSEEINSPDKIYNHYLQLINKMPLSVLKNKSDLSINANLEFIQNYDQEVVEEEHSQVNPTFFSGINLGDVLERDTTNMNCSTFGNKHKKISKFKISRRKTE